MKKLQMLKEQVNFQMLQMEKDNNNQYRYYGDIRNLKNIVDRNIQKSRKNTRILEDPK